MVLLETIKEVAALQRGEVLKKKDLVSRQALPHLSLKTASAIIISGIRRCGKSTLMHQIMEQSSDECYFNFEDQRIMGFNVNDFERLRDVLEEKNPCRRFYFDEIQNVPGWERFVRTMQDQGKRFVITGSNASLLSRELGTKLTGRHVRFELFPFSFREFLDFEKATPSAACFERYMTFGGFPEFLKGKDIQVLQELLQDIVARDIVVRHGLRESKTVKEMAVFLLTNVGKPFSYNGLAKQFSLGSPNSAIAYISYLEDSYMLFVIPRFDVSLKRQRLSPKKVYSIDTGFSSANSASFSKDKGRMLENAVFLHLRRENPDIFYFRERGECDFLVKEKGEITQAIQVCFQLSEENKDREINGLEEVMKKVGLKSGTLVTFDQEDYIGSIRIIPAWKWMMEDSRSRTQAQAMV